MDKNKTSKSKDLLTSAESETFETWTLVTPEIADKNQLNVKGVAATQTSGIENIDEPVREITTKKDDSHTDGELSDGISIISDSESAGRASPQPAPRRNISPMNHISDNLTDNESDNPDASGQSASITPSSTPDTAGGYSATDPDMSPPSLTNRMRQLRAEEPTERQILPMSGFNYSWLFYLTAVMALIAFMGRIRLPEWDDTPNPLHSKLDYLIRKMESIGDFQIYLDTRLGNLFGQLPQMDHNALYEDYIALLQGDDLSRGNDRIVAVSECGASYLKSERLSNDQFIFKRCIESQKQLKIDRVNELPKFSDQIRANGESVPVVDNPKPIEKIQSEAGNSKKNNNHKNRNEFVKHSSAKPADGNNKNQPIYEKEKKPKREKLDKFRDAETNIERDWENQLAGKKDWVLNKLKEGKRNSFYSVKNGDFRKADNDNDNDVSDWYEKLMHERADLRKLRDQMHRKHYGENKYNNWYLDRSSHRREARRERNAP